MAKARTDHDSPWKEILERYFPAFMQFFFPEAYGEIDWSEDYTFLDKELQAVIRGARTGRQYVDKLVRVRRLNGAEEWILIHVEVQGRKEARFARRMYVYSYRVFDRYGLWVVSMAVLADSNADWRPNEFGYSLWGCTTGIQFPVVKLIDWRERWAELEASTNPFACVVMACLETMTTRRNPVARKEAKIRLVRHMRRRGFSREDILELLRFIDWIMTLPEGLEQEFQEDLAREEEAVTYVTTWERGGMRRQLLCALEERFGTVPGDLSKRLRGTTAERLEYLMRKAVTAASLDAFMRHLPPVREEVPDASRQH